MFVCASFCMCKSAHFHMKIFAPRNKQYHVFFVWNIFTPWGRWYIPSRFLHWRNAGSKPRTHLCLHIPNTLLNSSYISSEGSNRPLPDPLSFKLQGTILSLSLSLSIGLCNGNNHKQSTNTAGLLLMVWIVSTQKFGLEISVNCEIRGENISQTLDYHCFYH